MHFHFLLLGVLKGEGKYVPKREKVKFCVEGTIMNDRTDVYDLVNFKLR